MTTIKGFRLWVFAIFAVLGLLALALWLDFRQQKPSFTIESFNVPLSTDSEHHVDIHIQLTIKNPNKLHSIIYDSSVFTVIYDEHTLVPKHNFLNPGFQQPKGKINHVNFDVDADFHQWEALRKRISNSSEPILKVELNTEIRYRDLGHKSKKYNLTYQVQFKIGSDGNISGKKKKVKLCNGSC